MPCHRLRFLGSAALLAALTACQAGPGACPAGTESRQRVELYFGRDSPNGSVSDEDWQGYLDEVLTPAFPQGLTVLRAKGQWVGGGGERVSEDSFVVLIYLPAGSLAEDSIDSAVAAYKSRFAQESVLLVEDRICLAFR